MVIDMEKYKVSETALQQGVQKIYKFDNNFGASVVKHTFSHGHKNDLWELAVVAFTDDKDVFKFNLRYDTHITSDVVGYLKQEDVDDLLKDIQALTQKDQLN